MPGAVGIRQNTRTTHSLPRSGIFGSISQHHVRVWKISQVCASPGVVRAHYITPVSAFFDHRQESQLRRHSTQSTDT